MVLLKDAIKIWYWHFLKAPLKQVQLEGDIFSR